MEPRKKFIRDIFKKLIKWVLFNFNTINMLVFSFLFRGRGSIMYVAVLILITVEKYVNNMCTLKKYTDSL